MTRRIALAILISACAMLIIGGISAYLSVRQTLLAELDDAIIERAMTVLRTAGVGDSQVDAAVPSGDRYMIRSDRGHTIARAQPLRREPQRPHVVSRGFAGTAGGERMRTMTLRISTPQAEEPVTIIYSSAADRFDRTMRRLALTLLIVMGAGIGLTASVAIWVSGIATRPLHETARKIGTIDDRHLDRRIDASALPVELAPVASRLNEMLERLESAFARRRQFMIDAAHELRSPVAALRTTLEVALQRPKEAAALTQVLERCLTSTRMLNRLADVLTEQLRSEMNPHLQSTEPVNVGRVLRDCVEVIEPLAHVKDVTVVRSFLSDVRLATESDRFRSIVMNLLSNAVEYAPVGGTVRIEFHRDAHSALLRVEDNGPGIAPEHLPHIFEPFYRGDGARQRQGEHLGLGLYLVRSHVEALGGKCSVDSALGRGTTFTIRLPAEIIIEEPPQIHAALMNHE